MNNDTPKPPSEGSSNQKPNPWAESEEDKRKAMEEQAATLANVTPIHNNLDLRILKAHGPAVKHDSEADERIQERIKFGQEAQRKQAASEELTPEEADFLEGLKYAKPSEQRAALEARAGFKVVNGEGNDYQVPDEDLPNQPQELETPPQE